jgi:hypothetical protein
LVRWLVSRPGATMEDLTGFEHPQGYRFDPSATVTDGGHSALVFRSG